MPENMDAVRVMTIHKSKGLEAPVVIVPWTDLRARMGNETVMVEREGLRLAAAMLNRFVCREGQCAVTDTSAEAGPATNAATDVDAAAAPAGSAPDYMTQSARVSLDAHGNVQPASSADAEPATATPRATKERP